MDQGFLHLYLVVWEKQTEKGQMMDKREAPIAVFDSGMGGVSVLRELIKTMPEEDFYYFGDSKNAPYGTKSTEKVRELTIAHTEDFMKMGAKGVVIACNTATSAAVRVLRLMYPELPLVGIEPAVKPAAEKYPQGNILVMATPITIREEKLHHLIERFGGHANVMPLACPGLLWKRAILTARNSMVSCAICWNPIKRIWMRSFWDAPTILLCARSSNGSLAIRWRSLTAVPGQRGKCADGLLWTVFCGKRPEDKEKSNFTTVILPKKEKIYLKNYCTTRQ